MNRVQFSNELFNNVTMTIKLKNLKAKQNI